MARPRFANSQLSRALLSDVFRHLNNIRCNGWRRWLQWVGNLTRWRSCSLANSMAWSVLWFTSPSSRWCEGSPVCIQRWWWNVAATSWTDLHLCSPIPVDWLQQLSHRVHHSLEMRSCAYAERQREEVHKFLQHSCSTERLCWHRGLHWTPCEPVVLPLSIRLCKLLPRLKSQFRRRSRCWGHWNYRTATHSLIQQRSARWHDDWSHWCVLNSWQSARVSTILFINWLNQSRPAMPVALLKGWAIPILYPPQCMPIFVHS